MGTGEYQLLDLPVIDAAVHYYGCGVKLDVDADSYGTYAGAIGVRIGSAKIEIVGNKLTANGIACAAAPALARTAEEAAARSHARTRAEERADT